MLEQEDTDRCQKNIIFPARSYDLWQRRLSVDRSYIHKTLTHLACLDSSVTGKD